MQRFLHDESGATSIEYGLIAVALIPILTKMGKQGSLAYFGLAGAMP
jgi:Flp pilus assembly pilin Flp